MIARSVMDGVSSVGERLAGVTGVWRFSLMVDVSTDLVQR